MLRRHLEEREEKRQKAKEKARRRRKAGRELLGKFDQRAGTLESEGNFDETLDETRRGDPERA